MINIGLVSFGYHDKKECKRIAQRIQTVTRRFQSSTHPVKFTRIEASNYQLKDTSDRLKWSEKIAEQDGYVFLIPKDTETIKNDIIEALERVSSQLENKTALLVYYGIENKFGDNLDAVELIRSQHMALLYDTVNLPYLEHMRASAFDKFEAIETETHHQLEKLLYWTMGMRYARNLYSQVK
ncbi:hypothetical protein GCM10008929_07280 [Alkalibacterium psychrotolerans]